MSTQNAEFRNRLQHLREVCKKAGVRLSHQRMVVFRAVAESNEHPDVESVYLAVRKHIPTVSLDTVYRTLWLLRDLGMIKTLGPPREKVRFDANMSKHHHFVCSECGLAQDFHCSELDELPIPENITELGAVKATYVELRGLCSSCLELNNGQNNDAAQRQGGTR